MPLFSKFLTQARLAQVREHLGRKILDIGCGYGELLEHLGPDVEFSRSGRPESRAPGQSGREACKASGSWPIRAGGYRAGRDRLGRLHLLTPL